MFQIKPEPKALQADNLLDAQSWEYIQDKLVQWGSNVANKKISRKISKGKLSYSVIVPDEKFKDYF